MGYLCHFDSITVLPHCMQTISKLHYCLFHLLVQKKNLSRSNFFSTQSNFLIVVKSKILPYKFTYLSNEHGQKYLNTFKEYWAWSKMFEHGQKIFKLADGFGLHISKFLPTPTNKLHKNKFFLRISDFATLYAPALLNIFLKYFMILM